MKKIFILLSLFLIAVSGYAMSTAKHFKKRAPAQIPTSSSQLEFLELKQFSTPKKKFELSGLVEAPDKNIYAISDKEINPFIFLVNWKKGEMTQHLPFGITDKIDIEAIDACDDSFYLSNEKNNKFYVVRKGDATKTIEVDLSKMDMKGGIFSGNDGFEGMALDCENQILYATKEMLPRFIVTIDLKKNKAIKKWTIPSVGDGDIDFTDAKYEKGFLYILERSSMTVVKVDVKTEKVIQRYSYSNMEKGPGYLFGPSSHNIGEALILTSDEIWIGFDSNGLKTTAKSQKELGLKGRDPLIIRFKRPDNF